MLRYGVKVVISNETMRNIANYMDDNLRETVHYKLAPCDNETFLKEYIKLDPDFEQLLYNEFGIELESEEN